ncbi:hydrolase [Streptomyces lincolnensis]|uniref:Hydrolase n=1 Tax=Streptomyces lincolnensis TaxID=1915 RepID=A0A1B1MPU8_STRLN|nr:alpha/beta fold hydrolase [Streptomyces lincolnensis]ANS70631.1 hydrolase [Streptomyces lincolnensis]
MIFDHHGEPVRTGRAAINGTSLHYRTSGSGPAVVLLHGVPKTSYHWRHLVPKLTPHHTVVAPDLRGLGDSARPADGYDSATMSDDIAALMDHLGHDTYSVIGEDWGAVIGYQLAARHRAHVDALVFAEALFPGFDFEDHTALTHENVSSGMHLWHLSFYFQPDTATPDAIEEYVRCYSMPGGIRAMLSIYRAMLVDAGHDLAEEVPDEMADVVLPFLAKQQV